MPDFRLIRVPITRILEEESLFSHREVMKANNYVEFLDKMKKMVIPDTYNFSVMVISSRLEVLSLERFLERGHTA